MKFLSVGLLFMVTGALAGRITYTTKYTEGGVSGKGGTEQKAGGSISDDDGKEVVKNMGTWSNGVYKAAKNANTGIIIVSKNTAVDTKSDAVTSNNEEQKIVNEHIKKT